MPPANLKRIRIQGPANTVNWFCLFDVVEYHFVLILIWALTVDILVGCLEIGFSAVVMTIATRESLDRHPRLRSQSGRYL